MTVQATGHTAFSVSRDGYDLHVHLTPSGRTDAQWIVFGNSLVTDLSIWDAQVKTLSDQFNILRYDQAGHGRSGVPKNPVDFDDLGADLLAVMDAAKVEKAIYVGLSMGVPTGLAAHRLAPNRFIALVFSDGQAKTAPGGAAGWDERIKGAHASGMETFAAATMDRWLTDATGQDKRTRLTHMIAATPLDGFTACATALKDYDYADELSRIACPTLLIAGAEDGAMPAGMANTLKPAIAGAQMQLIANAGHVPCFEQPEAFNTALSGFVVPFAGGNAP